MTSLMTPFVARQLNNLRIVPRQGHGSGGLRHEAVNQCGPQSLHRCRVHVSGVPVVQFPLELIASAEANGRRTKTMWRSAGLVVHSSPRQYERPDQEFNIVAISA